MTEKPPRYWDDYEVGQKFPLGSTSFTEQEIVEFARTYDPQSFHVDRAAAEQGDGVLDCHLAHAERDLRLGGLGQAVLDGGDHRREAVDADSKDLTLRVLRSLRSAKTHCIRLTEDRLQVRVALDHVLRSLVGLGLIPVGSCFSNNLDTGGALDCLLATLRALGLCGRTKHTVQDADFTFVADLLEEPGAELICGLDRISGDVGGEQIGRAHV